MNLSTTLLLLALIVGSTQTVLKQGSQQPSARSLSPMERVVPGCRDNDTLRALTGTRGSRRRYRGGPLVKSELTKALERAGVTLVHIVQPIADALKATKSYVNK